MYCFCIYHVFGMNIIVLMKMKFDFTDFTDKFR